LLVIPAKAGIQFFRASHQELDSRLRGNDETTGERFKLALERRATLV